MFYVYILESESKKDFYYVGFTADLNRRLEEHNSNKSAYTSTGSPWKLVSSITFNDKSKAVAFEKYLKSASGRLFMKKHF